jgi:hypothetical protein
MYGSELRTCGLGAVVAVLLGAGIGIGWHYLDNVGGEAAVASVATPLEKQDAPKPPLSCPPGSRECPALDVPQLPVLSRANNQPDPTHARGALRVMHAAHTSRARQLPPPRQPAGGERTAF